MASVDRLSLSPVKFSVRQDIEVPGQPIRGLAFLETGMASMTTAFEDGSEVEVGTFGFESVIGISALMGSLQSLNRVYTQIAGYGYHCPVANASAEFERSKGFQSLMLRYVQAQLLQSMQSTGCNAKHTVEQRLAKWLLLCADRTNSTSFVMPQVFIADMLGTRRTTVTVAANTFRRAGLIRYSRGHMEILDSAELEASSCECYRVIRDHLHSISSFASTIVG